MPAQGQDPIIEELESIHAEYAAKMRELHDRQKALMVKLMERLDAEQMQRTREALQNGDIDQEN